ncbi:hypothetical protein SCLARK_00919 [Spiroplasma clarkii]|nr:hypothetical protein [Spiroplasma clarkii]ARU91527.1 hypothetical protein SCLARK_00919 [Spiroplasma clarkii]
MNLKKRLINSFLIFGIITCILASSLSVWSAFTKRSPFFGTSYDNNYVVNEIELDSNKPAPHNFTIFYGDSMYNYANYKLSADETPVFNGNFASLRKTNNPWKELSLWQNDRKSQQMVMVFDMNAKISNVTVSIQGVNEASNNGVEAKINVMNFILSTKTIGTSTIPEGTTYFPDKIGGNTVVNPQIFPVQPFLVSFSSYTNKVIARHWNYNIIIQYLDNGVYKTKVEKVTLLVSDKTINPTSDFSFNAMTSPATLATYNFNAANIPPTQTTKSGVVTPLNKPDDEVANEIRDLYSANNYFDWMTHHDNYFPSYLDDKYADILKNNYSYMMQMGAQYAYAPIFGNSIMRVSVKNKKNYETHNKYFEEMADFSGDWFANENFEFSFDFNGFDKYLEFVKNNGFTKIYIPTITRGSNGLKFFYNYDNNAGVSSASLGSNNALYNIVSAVKDEFIDGYGNITNLGTSYINNFIPQYFQAVLNYLEQLSDEQKTTASGSKLEFYYSFDETSFEIDQAIIEQINQIDENKLLKSHAYLGWEYRVNIDDSDDLYQKFVEQFDDITIQQREIVVNALNDETRLANLKK